MFVAFPVWWLLGPGEAVWIVFGAVMAVYLSRLPRVEIPRGFTIWLLFIAWMMFSVIELDSALRVIGFGYRALSYLAVTVAFVYVYNARSSLSARYVTGVLTIFWLVAVVGGYISLFFPLLSIQTPFGLVLPESVRSNELVNEMVVRRTTQFNPDAYSATDPRPSAPFLYTNGWGNAYSLLIPMVIAYMAKVRSLKRFWLLALAIPVSLVPAFLTLNRGMFIGLAVAVVVAGIGFVLRGQFAPILALAALLAVVGVAFLVLPVAERLTDRLDVSSTTEDRANLYEETFDRTLESPIFGFGAPRPSESEGVPSAGTQGQLWMVMFSHGFPGAVLYMAWWAWSFVRSVRLEGPVEVASNIVVLLMFVESFYYGTLPVGIMIGMIAAALTQRPPDDPVAPFEPKVRAVRQFRPVIGTAARSTARSTR
jgi:hypothetical protein